MSLGLKRNIHPVSYTHLDVYKRQVDSLNDEQLAALKARIAEREKAAGEKSDESEKTEE